MIIDKLESPTLNEAPAFPEKSDQFTPDLAPVEPQLRPPVASGSGAYAPPSELPPPYVVRSNPVVDELRPRAEPPRANSHLQPVAEQEVNHLVLESKNTPISGSYLLNCELPSTFPPRARRKVALDSRNKKLFHKDPPPPTASVRTRHGDIKLNLATAGPTESLNKAHVQVSTRNAKVHVNVHSLQENKHICLEVSTRDGNMTVFVPPTFTGALRFRTRRGNIKFLPEFERWARIVNASDNGAIVIFSQGVQVPSIDVNHPMTDSCLLTTRHGKILIGVSGKDHYNEVEEPGLLEKLGSLSMIFLGRDVTAGLRMGIDALSAKAASLSTVSTVGPPR